MWNWVVCYLHKTLDVQVSGLLAGSSKQREESCSRYLIKKSYDSHTLSFIFDIPPCWLIENMILKKKRQKKNYLILEDIFYF